jgi:hypothetical protein
MAVADLDDPSDERDFRCLAVPITRSPSALACDIR